MNTDFYTKHFSAIIRCTKIVLALIFVFFFIWILNKNFVFNGKMNITYNVTDGSKLVKNFASKESDKLMGTENKKDGGGLFQLITKSPVYFDIPIPRSFKKATVTMKYKNPDSQGFIRLGVKQPNGAYYYTNMAYYNSFLESMPEYWNQIREGDLYLWQRNKNYYNALEKNKKNIATFISELDEWKSFQYAKLKSMQLNTDEYKKQKQYIDDEYTRRLDVAYQDNTVSKEKYHTPYSSISDFLNNLPKKDLIAQFNYDISKYIFLSEYRQSSSIQTVDRILRGRHELVTYKNDDENLNFTFTFQDSNRHAGSDDVNVIVYDYKDKKINEFRLEDTQSNVERDLSVIISDLPHGIYRLVIDVSDDIFIKKIATYQHLLMFKGHIFLADNAEYSEITESKRIEPTVLYTNSNFFQASTPHKSGFQNLIVEDEKNKNTLSLDAVKDMKTATRLMGISKIYSPQNDVRLSGDGFFFFGKNNFFDAAYATIPSLDMAGGIDSYDYIIANYPRTLPGEDGWLYATATIDANYLNADKKNLRFIIDLPNLHESKRTLKIQELKISLESDPVTFSKIWNIFYKLLQRI